MIVTPYTDIISYYHMYTGADTGGVLWVLKNPPSGKIHYKLSRGRFRGGGGLWGLSPTFIISVHARFSMSDSFVDLPQEVVNYSE